MKDKDKPNSISRRSFIKGVGSTVAGAYVISPELAKLSGKISKKAKYSNI